MKKNKSIIAVFFLAAIICSSITLLSCSKKGTSPQSDSQLVIIPPATIPIAHTPPKDSNFIVLDTKKVVEAYLTPSKWYTYSWNDINYSNVTHIVYSFLRPTSASNPTLTYGDAAYEQAAYSLYPGLIDKTFLGYGDQLIAKAHAANVKVLMGVAGGSGQDTRDLSAIFGNESLRKQFIINLVKLCEERSYDGITLDYEYPKNSSDGLGITNFAQELRVAFFTSPVLSKKDMIITLACPVGNWSGEFFDYTKLAKCVNWFSPMTYEYATGWTTSFSFNSPIYTNASAGANSTISTAISYLKTTRGINPLQIVIGVPFFGWAFDNFTQLGGIKANTNGADKAYTGLYNDYIKNMPANGFVKYWDDISKQSYLVNSGTKQMVTYDDENAIIEKCKYVKTNGLKGAMIWELSRGFINGASDPNPLLTALGSNLLR
ncbi:glycoside hydrolase family 18 protein [Pedobacter sp. PLR]|uniref:glycoside hydrolase family 18 protein n=1 Tax=Pedobacter sp. PLR TaxID=2994465 RepID=UPI0022475691|nr:glycoside hydrolase family 18 protein [Pedobacter sp. PLR]MCX2454318.1 glycoside hydrolase family 18 protein [Pedobacter sp. PLR]